MMTQTDRDRLQCSLSKHKQPCTMQVPNCNDKPKVRHTCTFSVHWFLWCLEAIPMAKPVTYANAVHVRRPFMTLVRACPTV